MNELGLIKPVDGLNERAFVAVAGTPTEASIPASSGLSAPPRRRLQEKILFPSYSSGPHLVGNRTLWLTRGGSISPDGKTANPRPP